MKCTENGQPKVRVVHPLNAIGSSSPISLEGISNLDLLRAYAKPGTIILMGGSYHDDSFIRREQGKRLLNNKRFSHWSHVFISQGIRADGQPWIIECDFDIDFIGRHVFYGVRECRADRYADASWYPNMAVLDLGLTPEQQQAIVGYALDFVSRGTRYSIWAALNTLFRWGKKPRFDEDQEMTSGHCGSFVRTLFLKIGIDLNPELPVRWTVPEHIAQTPVPSRMVQVVRQAKWNTMKAPTLAAPPTLVAAREGDPLDLIGAAFSEDSAA